jgi:O-antigen ligase
MLSLIALLLSRHRLAIIALLAIAATLAWISLPQDRQNRYLTLIDPSYGPANAQVSAEGRTQGFYDGLALWRAHPALGVGPGVFGIATGKGPQAHNLYGQVLGELGTLGAAAFGLVLLGFVANNIERRRVLRQRPDLGDTFSARLIQSVTVSIVLLLLMGLAGHNLYSYRWLWLGAFQAIALHCLPRHSEALVAETPQVLADGTAGGTCL